MIVQLKGDGFDRVRLTAAMHHPRDEKKRQEAGAVMMVSDLRRAGEHVSGALVDVLLDAPARTDVLGRMNVPAGRSAGLLLYALLSLHLPHGVREAKPNQDNAIDWVRRAINEPRSNLQRHWTTYQPATPLWLALLLAEQQAMPDPDRANIAIATLAARIQFAAQTKGIELDGSIDVIGYDGTPIRCDQSMYDEIPALTLSVGDLEFLRLFKRASKRPHKKKRP